MKLVHTVSDARLRVAEARTKGLTVGLVPTMGALHQGHVSLIEKARAQCGYAVVSIFVNPTQFGAGEDYDSYPRTLDDDAAKCESAGTDLVFAPSAAEMYPSGYNSWVEVGGITEVMEGAIRQGHFRGVTTVCAKLFNITDADYAYFGKKDYQQFRVIEKMTRELNLKTGIVPCEIVRDPDGLAMSSRNTYLSTNERRAAVVLSRSLGRARDLFERGERHVGSIRAAIESVIAGEPRARIDYVEIVDQSTFARMDVLNVPAVALIAVRIGSVRLLDNLELPGS